MTQNGIAGRLGYVALGVADVGRAARFYNEVAQLHITERTPDEVFLTGGVEHHWLHLYGSDRPGEFRVGYEVVDDDALGVLAERLSAQGIPYEEGGDLARDRIDRSLRFRNPDGVELEFYTQMMELPTRPQQPTVRMVKFLHAVWSTRTMAAGYEFHANVLGFRASDWIERRVVFLRCADRYHHSAGLVEMDGEPTLQHVCILVESIDDVMRARNNALARGAELLMDLLRHAASGSIGVYVKDPDLDFSIEFCCAHPQLEDDHRARILPKSQVTSDVWQELPATAPVPPPPLLSLPTPSQSTGSSREIA